ncbi:uncharacterized protein C11orf52 homolog isoform X1 [Anas acuta]|uniref:uncharacterized protein C11orf52 homolog isoform X1 n=1 Tax=Anas acuta TaxID=28680 RepID=UPI0035C883B5
MARTAPARRWRETRARETLPGSCRGPGRRKHGLCPATSRSCCAEEGATWATAAAAAARGTDVRHESQQHQPGRKAPTYENVSESLVYATVSKPKNMKQDDSIHYADIQVFTKVRERSAEEVKNLQMQNATEYATLNFPRPRLKYDSKNGTLV